MLNFGCVPLPGGTSRFEDREFVRQGSGQLDPSVGLMDKNPKLLDPWFLGWGFKEDILMGLLYVYIYIYV